MDEGVAEGKEEDEDECVVEVEDEGGGLRVG